MEIPIRGTITSGYGMRVNPLNKSQTKFHYGIDIGAPKGTLIPSNTTGVIKYAGWKKGYGNIVELETGGTLQKFAHLSKISVRKGQTVQIGDKLGEVGSTGDSTGNHLHWETLYEGKNINPVKHSITAGDRIREFFGMTTRVPVDNEKLLGSDLSIGEIKYNVSHLAINIILVVAVIVFLVFVFFPQNKIIQTIGKGVKK